MPIAIYHLQIKIISRGAGRSAVAAAAYRAGERITNERDGITHDYTRKSGIIHTGILLPENAPPEYKDRSVLWNAVERVEKAKNSQLAREIELALPVELTKEQNQFLVYEYVKRNFVRHGMCADVAIHDAITGNPHAHVLLTMRPFNENRTWGDKQKKIYHYDEHSNKIYDPKKRQYKCNKIQTTDWNEQTKAEEWRAAWADMVNGVLEHNGHAARIDHRSFERQGIEQIPTIHLGAAASQMEKRGIRTERGILNREIEINNQRLRQIKARLAKLQTWLLEEMQNTEQPMLADVISNILKRGHGYYSSMSGLKQAANILNFLTVNKIADMAGLDDYLQSMIGKRSALAKKLTPVERRLKTLAEHIDHSEKYKATRKYKIQYDKLCAEYDSIKKAGGLGAGRKAQKALDTANEYYETHVGQIITFRNADNYLRDVLQGHFDPAKLPPITKWKTERDKLNADHAALNREYTVLKSDTLAAEKIRSNVNDIMRAERRREQPQRAKGMER